jgi:hypothetical protein
MRTENQIEIYGLSTDGIAYCEAEGLSKVFAAYANECAGEYIMEVGFNPNSGYVYIALDNGISICSMLGRDVEYLTADFETGEEHFFDSYEQAQTFINK